MFSILLILAVLAVVYFAAVEANALVVLTLLAGLLVLLI